MMFAAFQSIKYFKIYLYTLTKGILERIERFYFCLARIFQVAYTEQYSCQLASYNR